MKKVVFFRRHEVVDEFLSKKMRLHPWPTVEIKFTTGVDSAAGGRTPVIELVDCNTNATHIIESFHMGNSGSIDYGQHSDGQRTLYSVKHMLWGHQPDLNYVYD